MQTEFLLRCIAAIFECNTTKEIRSSKEIRSFSQQAICVDNADKNAWLCSAASCAPPEGSIRERGWYRLGACLRISHIWGLYMEAFRVQQRLPANLTDDITNHAGQPPLSAVSQRPIFILARSIVRVIKLHTGSGCRPHSLVTKNPHEKIK